jgi:hypothetical protein
MARAESNVVRGRGIRLAIRWFVHGGTIMETTVRALKLARVRHLVVGLVLGAAALVLISPQARRSVLEPVVTRVTALTAQSAPGNASAVSASSRSARRVMTTAVEWLTIFAVVGALYNLREWRGKGRRYRNQRRRVANALLRADLRRSGRF